MTVKIENEIASSANVEFVKLFQDKDGQQILVFVDEVTDAYEEGEAEALYSAAMFTYIDKVPMYLKLRFGSARDAFEYFTKLTEEMAINLRKWIGEQCRSELKKT